MRRHSRPLSPAEALALLQAARRTRDRALVTLLWRGGLRSAEACALEVGDLEEVETGGLILHVRKGKGGVSRFVGIDKRAADVVCQHLERRGGAANYVLGTRTGRRMQTSSVRRTIARLAKTAGIGHRVHPHALRHTCARNMHDEGYTVREIQVHLGHSSLETTAVYLQSIGCGTVVAKATTREW